MLQEWESEFADEDEYRYESDLDASDRRYDEESGCCFPGECCMPGDHLRSECHTAAMIRDFNYLAIRGK